MEKISGIIPANSRVTTVDMKSSGQVRGGMPSFGRPVGITAAAEKQMAQKEMAAEMATEMAQNSTINTAAVRHKEQMNMRVRPEDAHVKIIQDMADGFFINKALREANEELESEAAPLNMDASADMQVDRPEDENDAAIGQRLNVRA